MLGFKIKKKFLLKGIGIHLMKLFMVLMMTMFIHIPIYLFFLLFDLGLAHLFSVNKFLFFTKYFSLSNIDNLFYHPSQILFLIIFSICWDAYNHSEGYKSSSFFDQWYFEPKKRLF